MLTAKRKCAQIRGAVEAQRVKHRDYEEQVGTALVAFDDLRGLDVAEARD